MPWFPHDLNWEAATSNINTGDINNIAGFVGGGLEGGILFLFIFGRDPWHVRS